MHDPERVWVAALVLVTKIVLRRICAARACSVRLNPLVKGSGVWALSRVMQGVSSEGPGCVHLGCPLLPFASIPFCKIPGGFVYRGRRSCVSSRIRQKHELKGRQNHGIGSELAAASLPVSESVARVKVSRNRAVWSTGSVVGRSSSFSRLYLLPHRVFTVSIRRPAGPRPVFVEFLKPAGLMALHPSTIAVRGRGWVSEALSRACQRFPPARRDPRVQAAVFCRRPLDCRRPRRSHLAHRTCAVATRYQQLLENDDRHVRALRSQSLTGTAGVHAC